MLKNDENNRIETIVEEINYWKNHKLLPETYCDYLLALYTNGDSKLDQEPTFIQRILSVFQILLCVMLLPFSFLVIYFTKFEFILQLAILILFITYSFWCYTYLRKQDHKFYHLALVVTLFILLLTSIFLGNVFIKNSPVILIIIILNFALWFYIGKKWNFLYLKFASAIGIVFSILYTFF